MAEFLLDGFPSGAGIAATFRAAATLGNDAVLQSVCQQGVDIEAKDEHGYTALLLAALNGHETAVKTLLSSGADVSTKTCSGWGALDCAVARRHIVVVKLLLQHTLDINSTCNQGWTALHRAASVGDETATRLLLDNGADSEKLDSSGLSPVQRAAHNDHVNVVSLLLNFDLRTGSDSIKIGNKVYPKATLSKMFEGLQRLEDNWDNGNYVKFQLGGTPHNEEQHNDWIYTTRLSQNFLVSASKDKSIRIWDLTTRRLETNNAKRFNTSNPPDANSAGHSGTVLCVQFDPSPGEDVLISGSVDESVIIWKFSTSEILHTIPNAHSSSVTNLKFDSRYLVTASKDKTVKIWNRHEINTTDDEFHWFQSEDASAVPPKDSVIPPYTTLRTLTGHKAGINSIALLHGSIVSASGDRQIRIWSILTGACLRIIDDGHKQGIATLDYDGTWIVTGSSDSTAGVFDRVTGERVARLEGHRGLVRSVQARIYDPEPSSTFQPDTEHEPIFHCRRHSKIVSGSYDETVKMWRCDQGGKWFLKRTLGPEYPDTDREAETHRIYSIQFDSRFLFVAGQDREILCYDFANGDEGIEEAVEWLRGL